jgi:hypothetical protein
VTKTSASSTADLNGTLYKAAKPSSFLNCTFGIFRGPKQDTPNSPSSKPIFTLLSIPEEQPQALGDLLRIRAAFSTDKLVLL